MKNNVSIAGRPVNDQHSPFVIAEAGSNFNQDFDTARRLIDVAAEAGAHAVKFQLFRADVLYPGGGELHKIFKSVELNPDWVPLLNEHAKSQGLHLLASAFDKASVDVLESINVAAHKIASSETTNLGFLHYVASKGRPIIISTGMCDMVDVEEAVNVSLGAGNSEIILLQCGAMYPLPPEMANLRVLKTLTDAFHCPVGFSDHTLNTSIAKVAVGMGANLFEKHFTLDRSAPGPDHFYALEPKELKLYIDGINEAYQALGSHIKEMLPQEKELGRREGLYAARDIEAGEILTAADISIRRPALGLRARYAPMVAGAVAKHRLKKDEPFTWNGIGF